MFLGQYRHTFDEKYRLTIPARFRELLADGAYVVQGFDRNLMVFTQETFGKISQRLNRMNMTDPEVRQLKRLLYSSADRVEPDRAGRILIPQFLREVAILEDEAVIVGIGDYFEIWSPKMWQEQETILQDVAANAQRFAAFDLSAE
ncbi:MAG: division/cell wall cluster transcriptional repressor MraZ [Chloroflexota bacterium]|jgi:MraZ protein